MKETQISMGEFSGWKNNPVTKKLFDKLEQAKYIYTEMLTKGWVLNSKNIEVETAKTIGILEGINLVLEAELVENEEEKNDEKPSKE